MPDLVVPDVPDDIVAGLDRHAEELGQSRDEFLRGLLARAAERRPMPVKDVLVVRDVPEEIFAGLDELAERLGLSRDELIRQALRSVVRRSTGPVTIEDVRRFAEVTDLGPWEPAGVAEVAALFDRFPGPWWIASGYAIELAVGRPFRSHADIDVLVLRRDHLSLHAVLPGWELWAADPPGTLRHWPGEPLPDHVHDIWCRPGPDRPRRVQVMLDNSDGEDWVSRRDPRIRRPLAELGRRSADGVPYLAPEVQLHYKAKGLRPKDQLDFDTALPVLDRSQRAWLDAALPPDHPWRNRLRGSARA